MPSPKYRPLIGVNLHVIPKVQEKRGRDILTPEQLSIEAGYVDCLVASGADCVLLPPCAP